MLHLPVRTALPHVDSHPRSRRDYVVDHLDFCDDGGGGDGGNGGGGDEDDVGKKSRCHSGMLLQAEATSESIP